MLQMWREVREDKRDNLVGEVVIADPDLGPVLGILAVLLVLFGFYAVL